jgi:hypothetical protein
MVAWQHTSVPALKLDRQGGEFVLVPTPTAEQTMTRRTAEMTLSPEGSLQGEITLEFRGNEALQRRLDALDTDESGRRRELEDQLLNWLPAGARVRWSGAQGWDSSEVPLVIRFHAEVPGFASAPGRRLLLPGSLFSSQPADLFGNSERKFPVYFPYTFEEIDQVSIRLPDDYVIQSLPIGEDVKLPAARFLTTRIQSGRDLKLTRALVVNGIYFQPEDYPSLRDFFGKTRAAAREQILLQGSGRHAF